MHFTKALSPTMARFGAKPHRFTMLLSCYQDKNDQGTFFVYDVKSGKRVDAATLERATEWYTRVTTQPIKVDEVEDTVSTAKTATERRTEAQTETRF